MRCHIAKKNSSDISTSPSNKRKANRSWNASDFLNLLPYVMTLLVFIIIDDRNICLFESLSGGGFLLLFLVSFQKK